jgi:UDPglucose 6-dehydrogenase
VHLFVVGAGHVGLVTAVGFARLGCRVTVTDIDPHRIELVGRAAPPFFEPGMDDALRDLLAAGTLRLTTEVVPPDDAPCSVICVPTPAGADGILSMAFVESTVGALVDHLGPERAIVVRSTLPLDGPARLAALVDGRASRPSILVNPEFMREGNALRDFAEPARVVVGALEPADMTAAAAFAGLYAPLDRPTIVTDARSAVLIKIASNVFLATKISFANELARLADAVGADAGTVADGLGLDPRIGRAFLDAGPGYGGSCLPEQAIALDREAARRDVPAPLLAGVAASNAVHQRAIVARLAADLGGSLAGRRVAILGLAFKARTDDVRLSPALALARELRAASATVIGHDPLAAANAVRHDPELLVGATPDEALAGVDAAIVATEWPEYAALDWPALAGRMRGRLVHDLRNVVDREAAAAAGVRLVPLGRSATAPEPRAPEGGSGG